MKRFIHIVIAFAFLCSCSADKLNIEMHEIINSKEHDPLLIGWWKFNNSDNEYLLFDDVNYELIIGEKDDKGNLVEYHNSKYWYTEDGILYTFKEATILTGIISSQEPYKLSEDNNTVLTPDYKGIYTTYLIRVNK